MNRRQLLVAGLGWFGASALGCSSMPRSMEPPRAPSPHVPPPRTAIVVGAGLAGLATATALIDAGFEVIVLEAQRRVGGRILTLRAPFSDGFHVEAGAMHVVGDPDLIALMAQVGIVPTRTKRSSGAALRVSHFGGRRVVTPRDAPEEPNPRLSSDEQRLGEDGRAAKFLGFGVDVDPRALDLGSPLIRRLDGMSMGDLLRERGASRGYVDAIGEQLAPDRDADEISALFVLRDFASIRLEIAQGGGGRVAGGLDQLPRALAARLGARVVLGAEVARIEQDGAGARVRYRLDGQEHEVCAARVVCAVPYGVLRHIDVLPAFGALKTRAIQELESASVTRTFVEVADRVWERRGEAARVETDLGVGMVRDETDQLVVERGAILGSYLSGRAARAASKKDEPTRIREATADLELVHPGAGAVVGHAVSRSWDADPFARGGYAWCKPGQLTTFGKELWSPEGRVHFAGDHTSYRPGFMHGAVASAKRVVSEILAAST